MATKDPRGVKQKHAGLSSPGSRAATFFRGFLSPLAGRTLERDFIL